jgi:HTH-type transcriptional regulator/antitoxin HipB
MMTAMITVVVAVVAAISVIRDKCFLSCITDNCHLSSKTDMKKKTDAGYPIKTPQQLGAVLQGFRKQRGLTQAQVARTGGLLQSAVSELELDSSTASLNRIFKLLAALDLELVVRSRGAFPKVSEW